MYLKIMFIYFRKKLTDLRICVYLYTDLSKLFQNFPHIQPPSTLYPIRTQLLTCHSTFSLLLQYPFLSIQGRVVWEIGKLNHKIFS